MNHVGRADVSLPASVIIDWQVEGLEHMARQIFSFVLFPQGRQMMIV
jgi:hypothetical protein